MNLPRTWQVPWVPERHVPPKDEVPRLKAWVRSGWTARAHSTKDGAEAAMGTRAAVGPTGMMCDTIIAPVYA